MPNKKKTSRAGRMNNWRPSAPQHKGSAPVLIVGIAAVIVIGIATFSGLFTPVERAQSSALRIESVASAGASSADSADSIDIVNTGSEPVNLHQYGLMLSDDPTDIFCFPDYSLASGERVTVRAGRDAVGDLAVPFGLKAAGGDTLILFDTASRVVDSVDLPEMKQDDVYTRRDDGSWELHVSELQTGMPELKPGALEITEVMASNSLYLPDAGGVCHDYIEIHNRSNSDVDLEGWQLSDKVNRPDRWRFPARTLHGGEYITVRCTGRNGGAELEAPFALTAGEIVLLSAPDGTPVSAVELPETESNVALSYANGAWTMALAPTPNYANDNSGVTATRREHFDGGLVISEVMASAVNESCDWIEILNRTNSPVDIGGYGLSDDAASPRKWQFPQGTQIAPGQYMLVCCSNRPEEEIGGVMNTGYALGVAGGYTVSLSDPEGKILDAIFIPQQYGGISYGREHDGDELRFFESGTPGEANSARGYVSRADKAVPSVAGGLFTSGQTLQITLDAPSGSRIYYTTDCTDPTERSTPYTGPITVTSNTVLRTRVYRDGCLPSLSDTQSYLYDVYTQADTYIVSVVADPDDLMSNERGIMVEGSGSRPNYEQNWEREAHIELFREDGARVLSQGVDIGLHGAGTRKGRIKSFNIKASGKYGDSRLRYPIFRDRPYQDYSSILLRPSGEDYNRTLMRDSLQSDLMKGTNLYYQKWELAVTYLNGEYYTIDYIRERITPDSLCQFHGWEGMEKEVDVCFNNRSVSHGSFEDFKQILATVKKTDMTTQEAYDYLDAHIDVDNYINYMCIEMFTGNTDTGNRRFYRNRRADGKWRWALYDLDWGFTNDSSDSISKWLDPRGAGVDRATDNTLFIAAMKNPIFVDKFLTRMGELLAGPFRTEYVLERIDERSDMLSGLLPEYCARWGFEAKRLNQAVTDMRSFVRERPTKLIGFIRNALKLSDNDIERYFGDAIQKIQSGGD